MDSRGDHPESPKQEKDEAFATEVRTTEREKA
jgi:hypothetical protein